MSYIHKFDKEYNEIKKGFKDNTITKWVQPSNKKEKCEIEVNFGTIDRTQDDSYKLFWDGECKNGKANGLGRVFESSDIYEQSLVSIYKNGKISNACFVKREFENTTLMGECRGNELDLDFDFLKIKNNGADNNFKLMNKRKLYTHQKPTYNVITKIYDSLQKFNIEQKYGTYGNIYTPILLNVKSPFTITDIDFKLFYNYGYQFTKYNSGRKWYGTMNQNAVAHGYQYIIESNGEKRAAEANNNNFVKRAILTNQFVQHFKDIENEVYEATLKSKTAYKKAKIIKEKYKNKICTDSIKVDFMSNNRYKEICKEEEFIAKLQEKINAKLALIEQKKHNQNLVNAEKAKATAQFMQAAAQNRAANASEQRNFNQSLQNINTNMNWQNTNFQLQQMNNYMRYGY
jgi:hypothetical protein